jgi:DNA-binding transcriptional MerR regulator
MDAPDLWTLDQLTERVEDALTVGYAGSPSGRVRSVPDRRAIRWYTTIGLIDRPAAMRGRTALYGERHLLQLVAVKRRQAEGRSLADIQAELAGATDATLRALAQVPGEAVAVPRPEPRAGRFWAGGPAVPEAKPAAAERAVGTAAMARPAPAAAPPSDLSSDLSRELASTSRDTAAGPAVAPAVALPGGVTLLLPPGSPYPTADDLHAISTAAVPLLAELARRGVIDTESPEGRT